MPLRRRSDRARQRCIDIACANHVNDADIVKAQEHRHVAWQLPFNLRADNVDSGNLQIGIDLPDCILCRGIPETSGTAVGLH